MAEASNNLEAKQLAKLSLCKITAELMPAGKPNYLGVIAFPKISDLLKEKGEPTVLLMLSIMVRNFCGSLNVQRNMNEEQILETAFMLINECGNFRLEDYVMMFEMAKKGELIKIYERIDIGIITQMLDLYFERRVQAKDNYERETTGMLDALGPVGRQKDSLTEDEMRVENLFNRLRSAVVDIKENFRADHEAKSGGNG